MKKYSCTSTALVLIVLLYILFPAIAYPNAAEPPSFTVIVSNPPEDLSLFLLLPNAGQTNAVKLIKEKKAWETYYRFFYHMSPSAGDKIENAVSIVGSSNQNFQVPLPVETFNRYNNLLTLDMVSKGLIIGQSAQRVPILVVLRVVSTLLIEGIVFFLFGYREKKSWLIFFGINILTQGGLNAMITGSGIGPYWMFGFIFGEVLILIVEIIAFISLVKELKKGRTVLFTVTANIVSLALGGLLIAYLPV